MARLYKTELVENNSNIKLWLGDCLDLMGEIPDNVAVNHIANSLRTYRLL